MLRATVAATKAAYFSGPVDPQTGAFSLSGEIAIVNFGDVQFVPVSFQGAPFDEGRQLGGTATVNGRGGTFVAKLCGNGNLDAGEACDDGRLTNGCCTSACTPKPDGTTCQSTIACQIAPTCSSGVCSGEPKPTGTECEADGNPCTEDACDSAGSCAAGPCSPCCYQPGCVASRPAGVCRRPTDERNSIDIQVTPFGTKDRIVWKVPHLQATSSTDLPDPLTTDYAACFYILDSDDFFTFYFDAVAPAGLGCGRSRCWTQSLKGGVAYNGGPLKPDGVASLRVKPGDEGKAQLSFVGRGPKLDLTAPLFIHGGELLVELRAGDRCWAAHHSTQGFPPDIRTNTRYRTKGGD